MNRHQRRAVLAIPSEVAIPCAGPFSAPPAPCAEVFRVPLPLDATTLAGALYRLGAFTSIASPPGAKPVLFTALCATCAERVLGKEIVDRARAHLGKLNEGAVQ